MKRGSDSGAFTIVETLIFLAVSALLLGSALVLITGQQNKTQFNQSTNDTVARIKDVIENVNSGYYNSPSGLSCSATAARPVFSGGGTGLGTNKECTYLGRVIQFAPGGLANAEKYKVYSVAGVRLTGSNNVPTSFAEALPQAISTVKYPGFDVTETSTLLYGLKITKMTFDAGLGPVDISAIGFFTNFHGYSSGNLDSGSKKTDVVPIRGTSLTGASSELSTVNGIECLKGGFGCQAVIKNPLKGTTICFKDDAVQKYGIIVIGAQGNNQEVDLQIKNFSQSPPECI